MILKNLQRHQLFLGHSIYTDTFYNPRCIRLILLPTTITTCYWKIFKSITLSVHMHPRRSRVPYIAIYKFFQQDASSTSLMYH